MMDTESSPDKQESTPKAPQKGGGSSRLPTIRTFHRDVKATQGTAEPETFAPSAPQEPTQPKKPAKPQQQEVPQSAPGFIPPKQLHRVDHPTPQPKPAPQPQQQTAEKQEAPQSALKKEPKKSIAHTYEDDAGRALKEKKGSVASIAVAEQKRRQERGETRKEEPAAWKKYLVRIVTVLLFLAGLGVLGYIFIGKSGSGTTTQEVEQSIIFADDIERQNISNLTAFELRDVIESFIASGVSDGTVHELRLIRNVGEGDAVTQTPLTPDELLTRLGLERRAPLARALGDHIMITKVGTNEPGTAVIADVSSYDSAFASMIRWEPSIIDDLYFLLPTQSTLPDTAATSTSQSPPQRSFVDIIIENRDARVLYGEDGKIMLLYSFPSTNTLVVTTNDSAFREVLERLERRAFIR